MKRNFFFWIRSDIEAYFSKIPIKDPIDEKAKGEKGRKKTKYKWER